VGELHLPLFGFAVCCSLSFRQSDGRFVRRAVPVEAASARRRDEESHWHGFRRAETIGELFQL
jgi:hypothetical protein